jgi:hypothetical protein
MLPYSFCYWWWHAFRNLNITSMEVKVTNGVSVDGKIGFPDIQQFF